jgi:hypothetical protein
VDLLVVGAIAVAAFSLGMVGLTAIVSGARAGSDHGHDPERCEECGSYRDSRPHAAEPVIGPSLGWTPCSLCGSPDPRLAWLEMGIWD